MDSEYDIYNYDKCQFFTILESPKFRSKYDLIRERQGIIICPLKICQQPLNSLLKQADLIDRHLFLPSPFYKNHYIPLSSLLKSYNQNDNYTGQEFASSASIILSSYYTANPSPTVHLALNLSSSNQNEHHHQTNIKTEFYLIKNSKQICKNVKLLNIQTGYNESSQQYKILIVNKELVYTTSNILKSPASSASLSRIDENAVKSNRKIRIVNYCSEDEEEEHGEKMKPASSPTSTPDFNNNRKRMPMFDPLSKTVSINDVLTFRQCIDFMHNAIFIIDENEFSNHDPSFNNARRKLNQCVIGEYLLGELELFKKTYIILPWYLKDCAKQLGNIYEKYLKRFLRSFSLDNRRLIDCIPDLDLIISIACEITILGCMYLKLWPCILTYCKSEDEDFGNKCAEIRKKLQIDNSNHEETVNSSSKLDLLSAYFNIDHTYFRINSKPILNELKKLSMLNSTLEIMICIRTSIDLLTNELTIFLLKLSNEAKKTKSSNIINNIQITSETLLPILAYLILKSDLDCFKSIIYFLDSFNFSSHQSEQQSNASFGNTSNSILISELNFFITSFKGAIQIIEKM
jgi:hypothetical protein